MFPEEEGLKREELFLYDHIEIIPVEAKTQISIYIKKNKFNLEIFQCFHQVPCVGYGVSEVRKKLKEEYTKLSGREIGELRKKGVEVNYECNAKFLCYLGILRRKFLRGSSGKR